ncbi:hypothetical protein [Tropicibacter sp. S64]|uniref:hypothetical protein n=1 Tax=Tropicibacter sp. S64 TaxID=3415122 RepID=UPI003C7AB0C5
MAIIGFLIGSLFGFLAGGFGWVFLDISFLTAGAVYLGCGVGLGLLFAIHGCLKAGPSLRQTEAAFS